MEIILLLVIGSIVLEIGGIALYFYIANRDKDNTNPPIDLI